MFAAQFAVIGLTGWLMRTRVPWEAIPGPVVQGMTLLVGISHLTFPVWGLIAGRQMGLQGGRLLAVLMVEGLMWLALSIAILPGVQ